MRCFCRVCVPPGAVRARAVISSRTAQRSSGKEDSWSRTGCAPDAFDSASDGRVTPFQVYRSPSVPFSLIPHPTGGNVYSVTLRIFSARVEWALLVLFRLNDERKNKFASIVGCNKRFAAEVNSVLLYDMKHQHNCPCRASDHRGPLFVSYPYALFLSRTRWASASYENTSLNDVRGTPVEVNWGLARVNQLSYSVLNPPRDRLFTFILEPLPDLGCPHASKVLRRTVNCYLPRYRICRTQLMALATPRYHRP